MMAIAREAPSADEDLAQIVARRLQSDGAMASARSAFEELYSRHARPLLAFLASRVRRADLDDLHQEVWQKVWHRLPDAFHGGQFRAWLHQIARNAVIDHARKKRPETLDEEVLLPDDRQESIDSRILEEERRAILGRCLEHLDQEAATLVRARLSGEAYTEICSALGLKPERARKVFHMAKAQLQACIERALE
jgi:RNA polymerase sigma factor (sigma-70 family)